MIEAPRPFRVLLIYPSLYMQTGIPLAIAALAGALRAAGIEVSVFTSYRYRMEGEFDQNELRSELIHSTIPVDYAQHGIHPHSPEADVLDDLERRIRDYEPGLIGISAVESVFARGMEMARVARTVSEAPIVAGGVFPTLAPEIAIQEDALDMICVGEGESAIVELARCLESGQDPRSIEGLWVKTPDGVVKNPRRIEDLDRLPPPDFSVLDDGMFLRPMRGRLYRTIPVEFSRGCPYKCSFCSEPKLESLFRERGSSGFFRKRDIGAVIRGLERDLELHHPEFFYFNSETFLAMTAREFDEFIEAYARIHIPFWIQTRPETLTADKIRRLQEVGLLWLSLGIEHGDEEFRRRVVRRSTRDELAYRVFEMLDECDQGASANMIIGFPFETRPLVYQTIKFSREVFRINPRCRMSVSIFAPFRGSELYDVSVRNGLWDGSVPYISETNITRPGMLTLSDLRESEVEGLYRCFPLYTYLPDEFQHLVPLAEELTPEGNERYRFLNRLVDECLALPLERHRRNKSLEETAGRLVAHLSIDEARTLGVKPLQLSDLKRDGLRALDPIS